MLRSLFGKVQDTLTTAVYGVEKRSTKMSLYSCVDCNMAGDKVQVRSCCGLRPRPTAESGFVDEMFVDTISSCFFYWFVSRCPTSKEVRARYIMHGPLCGPGSQVR